MCLYGIEIEISVPFYINDERVKDIPVLLEVDNDLVSLDQIEFKAVLYDYLTPIGMDRLEDFLKLLGFIPETIPKADKYFNIFFSTQDQAIYLGADLSLLRTRYTDVTRPKVFRAIRGGKRIEPEAFSGYVNVEGGLRDRRNILEKFRPGGASTFGNFNCNINYKDTVLEGYGYFISNNTFGINPASGILTREFRNTGVKWSLGTLNPVGISFQGSSPLLGLNFRRRSDLITDATVGAMSRHDIFLNAPSEIRILVNGIDVNRVDLPAGNHTLQNFPLAQGLNNVVLKILGPTGEEREVDVSMFYNPSTMRVGDIETNISIGVPYYDVDRGASGFYDFIPSLAFSGYLKRGFTPDFTLGGYLQLMGEKYYAGLQGIFAKPYFKTISEIGISSQEQLNERPYLRGRVAILQPAAWKLPITWNLAFEAAEKGFRYFGGTDTPENMSFVASGSLGTYAYKTMSLNIVAQYGYYRDQGKVYSAQTTLSVRPKPWLSVRGLVKWEETDLTPGKFETAVNFELSPTYKDFGTRTIYNTYQKALTAAVTYNKALAGRRSISGSVGYNTAPGADQLEGAVKYEGAHILASASQQLMKGSAAIVDSTVAITNVNLGTALVFAGKNVAISRPLRESFVIISPNQFLRKTPVVVNPTRDGYLAKATYLLPTVVPLQSHSKRNLSIVQEDGAYGGSFEDTDYEVCSLTKSGGVITVGDRPKLIIEGVLFANGKEAEGLTGMLISNFKENGETFKYRFFTDSEGTFQITGVIPGSYSMKFTNKKFYPINNIEVEEVDEEFNFVYLGEYFIERKPEIKRHKELRNNE